MTRMMKDSGVEWIGRIPEGWNDIKIKYIYDVKKAKLPTAFYDDNSLIPYMSMDYIRGAESTPQYAKDGDYCKKSDVLVLWDGSNAGEIILEHPEGYAPSTTAILSPKRKFNEAFVKYYLKFLEMQLRKNRTGMGIPHVDGEFLRNAIVVLPLEEVQEKISRFLDDKIGEVDTIITKTKQSIDEYKKYRKAIVIKAVTKGLHPDVIMKKTDSDWIGEIPTHWDYVRIQRLFETVDERNDDENALLLSLYTALGVKPRSELEEKGNKASTVINYKKVQKNDVIVNKLLAWMGAIGYSDYEGVTSPDYDVYRAREDANVVRNYYNEYFRNTCFNGDCYKYGHGIMLMRWRTYPEEFLRIRVPNPPLAEQLEIADYLDEKCGEIDALIAKKEAFVEEMEAYKKSLIYEYVTGKKEVL